MRAVVRTALHHGASVFAIYEGYQGWSTAATASGRCRWDDVGGILHAAAP